MLVHQAFRYELAPTAAQRASLTNHAGAARWAWNWGLSVRRKAFTRRRQTMNAMDLHRLLNRLKRTPRYGWLYEVSKCAPQEALRDLDRAYANAWRGRKVRPADRSAQVEETRPLPGAVPPDRRDPGPGWRGRAAPDRPGSHQGVDRQVLWADPVGHLPAAG